MENAKDWLDKKGYYNSGLRTDRNHRIDLYLSDVLDEYRTELLRIHNVVVPKGTLCQCECEMPTLDGRKGLCGKCERPIIA